MGSIRTLVVSWLRSRAYVESYASSSPEEAAEYLAGEVACVSSAAQVALDLGSQPRSPYILSVGATPTAHAVDTLKATKVPGIIEL